MTIALTDFRPVRGPMFRISHVLGAHRQYDRRCLDEIQALFAAAFPELGHAGNYVAEKLSSAGGRGYPAILLVAHGPGDRVIGFALADYFESIGYAYLDFIVTEAKRRGRGLGGALYEALREDLIARGASGLLLEAPTDDPVQVTDLAHLRANRARLKFYERYGALPIMGTLYDQPIRTGVKAEPRLLYDPLTSDGELDAETLRQVIELILTNRYHYDPEDPYVGQVLGSVKESPVRLRRPRYVRPADQRLTTRRRLQPLKVFCSSVHALHHVPERGYVERPARVDVILRALAALPDVERLPVRSFGALDTGRA
jgi:GNAT superfamily N-acetyltransferase